MAGKELWGRILGGRSSLQAPRDGSALGSGEGGDGRRSQQHLREILLEMREERGSLAGNKEVFKACSASWAGFSSQRQALWQAF